MKPASKNLVFAKARETFPHLEPSMPTGFASVDYGMSVVVSHNTGQLVLATNTDLERMMVFCNSALDHRAEVKNGRRN